MRELATALVAFATNFFQSGAEIGLTVQQEFRRGVGDLDLSNLFRLIPCNTSFISQRSTEPTMMVLFSYEFFFLFSFFFFLLLAEPLLPVCALGVGPMCD